jgi:hypothetical protein
MSEELISLEELQKKANLPSIGKIASVNIPKMLSAVHSAEQALKQVAEIDTDEKDQEINGLLVKVRNTYDDIQEKRKQITDPLDDLRKHLMEIENKLSLKPGVENEVNRVKSLRDQYYQKKLEEKKSKEKGIELRKEIENLKTDIRAEVSTNVETGPNKLMIKNSEAMEKWLKSITLDNYDERLKNLTSFKPKLKQDVYEGWFKVGVDISKIPDDELNSLMDELKKQYPYDIINKTYVEKAIKELDEWKDKAENYKGQLKELQQEKNENERKRKAQEQLKSQEEEARKKRQELEQDSKSKEQAIADQKESDQMSNMFEEQVKKQGIEEVGPSGKILRFKDDKLDLKSFMEIIFHCTLHQKFPGIYATDSKKKIKLDKLGNKVYIPPVEWWLKFFANYVEGVEIKNVDVIDVAKVSVRKP